MTQKENDGAGKEEMVPPWRRSVIVACVEERRGGHVFVQGVAREL
jgi:hypothetical protein